MIHQETGVKQMAKSFPWTVVLLAVSTKWQKNINVNDLIDEFESIKKEKLHCKFSVYVKNVNKL
jgi:hypothetical protein